MNILAALSQLLPLILQAIHTVETVYPATGSGATKLGVVLSTVDAAVKAAPEIAQHAEAIKAPAQNLVGSIVGILNATGAWQKSGLVQGLNAFAKSGD